MKLPNAVRRMVPYWLKDGVRLVQSIGHRHTNGLVPPAYLRSVGDGDYLSIGKLYTDLFKEAGLKRDDNFLDVGCGTGRMAIHLVDYLKHYTGFDIMRREIRWCREIIACKNPNFSFDHVNVFNKSYNPRGTIAPECLKFPYSDDTFDWVFLGSVFTHMRMESVQNYINEISRVLNSGGTCFVTFFLLTDDAKTLMQRSSWNFRIDLGGYFTLDEVVPENAIAYPEAFVREVFDANGLEITEIRYGSWCGRHDKMPKQDIVLAKKRYIGQ